MVATSLTFLTPLGAVLALGVMVPLLALLAVRRRAHRVRRVVGLEGATVRRLVVPIGALVAAGALLGTAAAQPVLERTSDRHVRTDAEVFVVIDVSRSMLAQGRGSPTRLERAKTTAADLRAALPDVPVGIASLTDRVLPHLFPSADVDVFNATLDRSIGIERPPPASSLATLATSIDSLRSIRSLRFFRPTSERQLLVVFTDGESQPVARARLAALFRQPPVIEVIFVHLWDEDERVYSRGVAEPQYRPDPSARPLLDGIAASLKGAVFTERSLGAITDRARRALGDGPTVTHGQSRGREALAPYLAIVAFLPLGLLLWRPER